MSKNPYSPSSQILVPTVIEKTTAGEVEEIDVYGNDLLVHTKDGKLYRSRKELDTSLVELLAHLRLDSGQNGVKVIPGFCPLMYLRGTGFGHQAHGFVARLVGAAPR